MSEHVQNKSLQCIVLLMVFLVYSSLSVARCNQDTIYIKPTISELQAAATAAGKGGMLSSAWHESTMRISCTGMGTIGAGGSPTNYIYEYSMRAQDAGSGITFEGVFYPLWLTGDPDVLMIVSIASQNGEFSPVPISTYRQFVSISSPDANGNIQDGVRVRIRYFSTKSSLTAGAKVLKGMSLLLGGVRLVNFATCVSEAGSSDTSCYARGSGVSVSPLSFNVNSISCRLDAPSQVKLRSLNLTNLSSARAIAEGASFQLGVSCNKALVTYRVYYSMIDVNDPTNTSSNLTLAAFPEQASGVSLQVLDDGQPLRFGLKGSLKSIGVMTVTGGIQKKTLSVGYVRNGSIVKPGKVNAGVSVTLSYE